MATQSPRTTVPAGLDGQALDAWFAARLDVDPSTLDYSVLSVGRSNLTFVVTEAGHPRWVLRRPPLGHEGGTAHDVVREGTIMAALRSTPVPVPPVVEVHRDADVLDAPFFLMEHVAGFPLNTPADLANIAFDKRRGAALAMVDALVDIHRVDIHEVGLSSLHRDGSLVDRQLRRWLGQFEKVSTRKIPVIQEVHDRLVAARPKSSTVGLTHGDFKPNNMIFDESGAIKAVVDWELSAVGEVMLDLGWLVSMWTPNSPTGIWVPGEADGFPPVSGYVDRYRELTGADTSDLRFYHAFALWKLACIREGVYTRLRSGAMGDLVAADAEETGAGVEPLAASALDVLDGDVAYD